jgi:hypothetical protein
MALAVTSNFAGKAAGFYIAAALKEAKSLDYLTMFVTSLTFNQWQTQVSLETLLVTLQKTEHLQ